MTAPPRSGQPVAPERAYETPATGLTEGDVRERVERGETNASGERSSRTFGEILRANIFTRFNAILGVLLVVILAVGHPQDALFGIVLVSNALIGIVQEVRAKRTLDQLAVLSEPRVRLVRDGEVRDVAVDDVVLDDLIELRSGDQIAADGIVRATTALQVDESLLTGESDPVDKETGEHVLSGSFVVAGSGRFQATAVGDEAYARKLATEARRFALARSELVDGINRILRYVTWAIFPVAVLLLVSQFYAHDDWREAVSGTVAGVVGMVPQGLVLLTSVAFGVAAVALARRKVLVQELPAVEGLARVDVVCFDKTGTLTDGNIVFDRVERLDDQAPVEAALGALASDEDRNATLNAIAAAFPTTDSWRRTGFVPFSSARKWSAATFGDHGTWVLGAPELVWAGRDGEVAEKAEAFAGTGQRVLLLARTDAPLEGESLPAGMHPAALVLLEEQVRSDAAETLAYFAQQGVALNVISGDNPHTVGAVAARVGMPHADRPFDARDLPEDLDELGETLERHSVFGRVTPHQKQDMVKALQGRGHTVAMTGDGVNDALALKLADIGVAMGSGAPATRAVAQLVLLDSEFSTMPGVVAEGRRVTANIERVANLFITKTVWATLLAIAVGLAFWPYPFLPRHLTIVDTLTIGIPSFFLALAPNLRRYVPGFVDRVFRFTIPAGTIAAVATFSAFALARFDDVPLTQQRTAATLVMLMMSLCVLVILAQPLTWRRVVLVGLMIAGFALLFPNESVREFYDLKLPSDVLTGTLLIGFVGVAVLAGGWEVARRLGRGPAAAVQAGTVTASRAA
ncbi:MAG TPA: HAD-IC family P-type ATPase [Acidimicrobiia bacterium]|nr:HAD-IC family P-type ATPase [Acidimicrobiia bacterium]